ncbi:conserved Plasmodium protein, unknown function [Plasmodium gallinaceum]|uniref:Uncharacterized protein n=1 Tax=Plasmodium gallinaceum TaxID=5849 RepID=A0A1J1GTJ4_PLAGA|nr:conserved Plasmodium protein, unknown function [Plasmodium gallinaceum]CRG94622.1 conserved Plasmodium protein, unknown function [Plasmodium gallinaceum]
MHIQKHFSLTPTQDKNLENLVNELAESKKNIREIQKYGAKLKTNDKPIYKDFTHLREKCDIQTVSHNFLKKKDKESNFKENPNEVNKNTSIFINKKLRENKNLDNKHRNDNIFFMNKEDNQDNLLSYNSKLFQRIFKNITEEKIKNKNKKIKNKNLNNVKKNHLSESVIELKKVLDDNKQIISNLKFKNKNYNSQSIHSISFSSENESSENFNNHKNKNLNVMHPNFKNSNEIKEEIEEQEETDEKKEKNEEEEEEEERKEEEYKEEKKDEKKEKNDKEERKEEEYKEEIKDEMKEKNDKEEKHEVEKKYRKENILGNLNNNVNEYLNINSKKHFMNCEQNSNYNSYIKNNDDDKEKKYKIENISYKKFKEKKIHNKKKKIVKKNTYETNNNTLNNENDINCNYNNINNNKCFCIDNYKIGCGNFYMSNKERMRKFKNERKNKEYSYQHFCKIYSYASKKNKNNKFSSLKGRKLYFKMFDNYIDNLKNNNDFIFKNKCNSPNQILLNKDIFDKKRKEKYYSKKVSYIKNPLKEKLLCKLSESPFNKFQTLVLKKKKKKINIHFSTLKKYKKKNIEKHINIFKKYLYRNMENIRSRISEEGFNNTRENLNNYQSYLCIKCSRNNSKNFDPEKNSKDKIKYNDNVLKECRIHNNVNINYINNNNNNNNNIMKEDLHKTNKCKFTTVNSHLKEIIKNNLKEKLNEDKFVEHMISNGEMESAYYGNDKKLTVKRDKKDKLYKGIKSDINCSLRNSSEEKLSHNLSNDNMINLNNSKSYVMNSNKSDLLNHKIYNYVNKSNFINRKSSIEKCENIKKNTIPLDNFNLNNYEEIRKNIIDDLSSIYSSFETNEKRNEMFNRKKYKKNTKYIHKDKNKLKHNDQEDILLKNDSNNKYKSKKKILMEILSFYKRYKNKLKILLLEEYHYLKCLRININNNIYKFEKYKNDIYVNEEFKKDKNYFKKFLNPLNNYILKDSKMYNSCEENNYPYVNNGENGFKKKKENLIKIYANKIDTMSIYIKAKRRIKEIEKCLEKIKKSSLYKKSNIFKTNNNLKKNSIENYNKIDEKNMYEKNILDLRYNNINYIKNNSEVNKKKEKTNNFINIRNKKKFKNVLNKEEKKIFTKNEWKKVKKNNNFKHSYLYDVPLGNIYKYYFRIKPFKYILFYRKNLKRNNSFNSNSLINNIIKNYAISFFNNKKKIFINCYENSNDYKKILLPFKNKKYYFNLINIKKNYFSRQLKNISKFINKSNENVYKLEKKSSSNSLNFFNQTNKEYNNFYNSNNVKNCSYGVLKNNINYCINENLNINDDNNTSIHEEKPSIIVENNNNNEKCFINKENDNYTTEVKSTSNKYSFINNSTRDNNKINLYSNLNNKLNIKNNVKEEKMKYIKNKIINDKMNNCYLNSKKNKENKKKCIGYNIYDDINAKTKNDNVNKIIYHLDNFNLLNKSSICEKFYDESFKEKNIISIHNSINPFDAKNNFKLEDTNNCEKNNISVNYEPVSNNNIFNSYKKNTFISSNNDDFIINSINCDESNNFFKFYNKNIKEKEKIGSLNLQELDNQIIHNTNKYKKDNIEGEESHFNSYENKYDKTENKNESKNFCILNNSYNENMNIPYYKKETLKKNNKKEMNINSPKCEEQIKEKKRDDENKKKLLKISTEKIEQKKNISKSYIKEVEVEKNTNEFKELVKEQYMKNKGGIIYDINNDKNRMFDKIFINNSNKNCTINKMVDNINDKEIQEEVDKNFLINNDIDINNINLKKYLEKNNILNYKKGNDNYDLNGIYNNNYIDSTFLRKNLIDYSENTCFPLTPVNDQYKETIYKNMGSEKNKKRNIAKEQINDSYKINSHDDKKNKEKVLLENERIYYNINSSPVNNENNRLESFETINFDNYRKNFNELNFLNFSKNENYDCYFNMNASDNLINKAYPNTYSILKGKDKNNFFLKKNDMTFSELNSSTNSLNEKNENYLISQKNNRYNLKKLKSDNNENINIKLSNFCNIYDKKNCNFSENESYKKSLNYNDEFSEKNCKYDEDEMIQQSYKGNLSYRSYKNLNNNYYDTENFLHNFDYMYEMPNTHENDTLNNLSNSIINIEKLDKIIEKLHKLKIHILNDNNYIQCMYCDKYLFKLENYSGEDLLTFSKNLNIRKEKYACTICKHKVKMSNKYKDNVALNNDNIEKKNEKKHTNDEIKKLNTSDKIKYSENNFHLDNYSYFTNKLLNRDKLNYDYIKNKIFNQNMQNNKKEHNFFEYNDLFIKDNSCNNIDNISDCHSEEKEFLFSNHSLFENEMIKSFDDFTTSPSIRSIGNKYSINNYTPHKNFIFNNKVTYKSFENKKKSDTINYHYPYSNDCVFNNKNYDHYIKKLDHLNLNNRIDFKDKSFSNDNFTFSNNSKCNLKKINKNFSLNFNILNRKKTENDLLKCNDNDDIHYNSNCINNTNNSDYYNETNSSRNDSDKQNYKNFSKKYNINIGIINKKISNNDTLIDEIEKNKIKENNQINITNKKVLEHEQISNVLIKNNSFNIYDNQLDKKCEVNEKTIKKKKEIKNEMEDKKKVELEEETKIIHEEIKRGNEKKINIKNNFLKKSYNSFDYFKDKKCSSDYEKREKKYLLSQNNINPSENKEKPNLNIKNDLLKKILDRNNSINKETNNFLNKKNTFFNSFLINKDINVSDNLIETNNCFNTSYLNNLISQREKNSIYIDYKN